MKVISEVRCDHSELTSRIPTIGSRMVAGHVADHSMSWNVWSSALPKTMLRTTTAIIAPSVPSWSQKPARVSTILRSSTPTSRGSPGAPVDGRPARLVIRQLQQRCSCEASVLVGEVEEQLLEVGAVGRPDPAEDDVSGQCGAADLL